MPVGHFREDFSENGDAWNYFLPASAMTQQRAGARRTNFSGRTI
jgi:hypothetical protein